MRSILFLSCLTLAAIAQQLKNRIFVGQDITCENMREAKLSGGGYFGSHEPLDRCQKVCEETEGCLYYTEDNCELYSNQCAKKYV